MFKLIFRLPIYHSFFSFLFKYDNNYTCTSTKSQKHILPSSDPLTTCVSVWFIQLSILYSLFLWPEYSPSSSPESLSSSRNVLSMEDTSMHWPSLVNVTQVTGSVKVQEDWIAWLMIAWLIDWYIFKIALKVNGWLLDNSLLYFKKNIVLVSKSTFN